MKHGFLFFKKKCGLPAVGQCSACRVGICRGHGVNAEGNVLCKPCYERMHSYAAAPTIIHTHRYPGTSFGHTDSAVFNRQDNEPMEAGASWDSDSSDSSGGGGSWDDPS